MMPLVVVLQYKVAVLIINFVLAVLRTKTTAKGVSILGIGSIRMSALPRSKGIWKARRPWK